MDPALAGPVDALEQTWQSLRSVLDGLGEEEWALPTGCPGWSVQDSVSHIIGLERHIRGEPPPEHHELPDLSHVTSNQDRFMEIPVDLRRSHSPDEILAEFTEVTTQRIKDWRTVDIPADLGVPLPIGGELPIKQALALRVFDCYCHEQDVRRATDRPGNLTGPAAAIARQYIVGAWSAQVAYNSELADIEVVLEIDGEPHRLSPLRPENGGREGGELRLQSSFSNAMALGGGRSDASLAEVTVIGDGGLFAALAPRLGFTP